MWRQVEVWLAFSGHTECLKKFHMLILKAYNVLLQGLQCCQKSCPHWLLLPKSSTL